MIADFRPRRPPRAPTPVPKREFGVDRSSPRTRGLDTKWDRLSVAYRRAHPFCEESERRGVDASAEIVDHIIPRSVRPDLTYDWKNLQSLTKALHDGWKARLEAYAIETGQVEMLPLWCRHPETRPAGFKIIA